MTVRELREQLDELDDHLLVVVPMSRDGDYEEEPVGDVVQRDSMYGEGAVAVIVSERDL